MGTELTTPVTRANVQSQAIVRFGVRVPHTFDVNGNAVINRPGIRLSYTVQTFDANGEITDTINGSEEFVNFPAALKTELSSLYKKIESHARSMGLLGAGADEDM